jgi:tetratricopeptide (TPR) repeat protein
LLLQPSEHPREAACLFQLADIFIRLAALFSDAGNLDAALVLDEEVLSMRRKLLPSFHIQLGESMHNLAHSYFDMGRYDDALLLRIEELAVFQNCLTQSDHRIAECMEQLAQTYSALGQVENALQYDLIVLDLRRQNNCEHHAEIIASLINLSTSYLDVGDTANSTACLEEALSSQEVTLSPDDEDIRKTMMQLVELYTQEKQIEKALQMQKKLVQFCHLHLIPDSIDTVLTTLALAKLQLDMGSPTEAHALNVEVVAKCDSRIAALLKDTFWNKYIAAISGD